MPSVPASGSGTQSASIDTEHSLFSTTTAGTYVLVVDLNAMANGDGLRLRLKTKVLNGGTRRTVYCAFYANEQPTDDKIVYSVPIPVTEDLEATLEQFMGTGRSFPWKILLL